MKKKILLCIFYLFIGILFVNIYNYNKFCYAEKTSDKKYSGEITHVFTHCLLSEPSFALSKSNPLSKDYERDCITPNEFKKILYHLYNNNYILINPNEIFIVQNNIIKRKSLYIPEGKKPLIFSFDDVNYDTRKMGHGMVDRIGINSNKEIVSITMKNGVETQSKDNEFIPILNEFVKHNPSFSHNGAKGMICLTGYDGILGYRTQGKNTKNRGEEIEKAKIIVDLLKKEGWSFACHSFGHYHMKKISDQQFQEEIEMWEKEVTPLIGQTEIYVYPYGEWEIFNKNTNTLSNKHIMLKKAGFKLFCGVGIKNFISYFPRNLPQEEQVLFMDRCPIDGYTLKNKGKELSHLFPYQSVFDYKNRN